MRLVHVSESAGIQVFEPRRSVESGESALVWAVDARHLVNYLVPRECPRVCFRLAERTSRADREHFLAGGIGPVVAIDARWLEQAGSTALWLYDLPPEPFRVADANAGYYVTPVAVRPLRWRRVDRPLDELVALGAELRVVDDLPSLAATVAASTLSFSCIRMRNMGA